MEREGPPSEVRSTPGVVEVRLPETSATGYRWTVAHVATGAELVGEAYEEEKERRPIAGGSGEHVFRFRVRTPGRYEIELRLRRPWEDRALERRVVTLAVEAQEEE